MIADVYAELRSVEAVQEDTERTMIVTVSDEEIILFYFVTFRTN